MPEKEYAAATLAGALTTAPEGLLFGSVRPGEVVRGACGVPGCTAPDCPIVYGLCHCGCGGKTTLAKDSCRSRNLVKDEPRLYLRCHMLRGHDGRDARWSNPVGYVCARDGGDRLKEAREAKGLSQNQLTRAAEVGKSQTVCNLEGIAGHKTRIEKAKRIAAVLEVGFDQLFTHEFSRVDTSKRVRTRPGASRGSTALTASADCDRYCLEHSYWTGEQAADFLCVNPKTVTIYTRQGLLDVVKVYVGTPFTANLYRIENVKRFARARHKKEDYRVRCQRNPLWVYRWAIKRGYSDEHADRLMARCQERNERHAKLRTAEFGPAYERHHRWASLWIALRAEYPEIDPPLLIGDVAERDWQENFEDWPRDRYPASGSCGESIDPRYRKAARDRVQKALQKLTKSS
jgi:DNA-binding XRE family transcriptional regulator